MKVRIARIAKRMHNKFRGLYWRQMFVTVGMVLLTLFLLGVSFFSLSYNYARGQENGGAGRPGPGGGAALRQLSGKRAVPGHGGAAARGGLPASGLLRCHGVRGGLPDLRRGGPRAAVHGCVSQRAGGDYAGGDDRRGAGGGHQLQAHGRGRPVLQQAVRGGRSGHKRGYPPTPSAWSMPCLPPPRWTPCGPASSGCSS